MIGIFTFQHTINYGANLQMYALQKCIQTLGGDVEVINYCNPIVENREFPKLKDNLSPKKFVKYILIKTLTIKKKEVFNDFKNQEIKLSDQVFNANNFHEIQGRYNKVIVGSDQVWNTNLNGGDVHYYLPNLRTSLYSYAASFGVDSVDKLENTEKIASALKEFKLISTREFAGKKIAEELSGKEVQVVLDPTFLVNKTEWTYFGKKSKKNTEDDYLLVYFVKNKGTLSFARQYAKKNNLKIKYISMRPFIEKGIEVIDDASPYDFVNLINNAKATIVGSYHGFILSLNLNTPVLLDLDQQKLNFNSRMLSVFKMFDLPQTLMLADGNVKLYNNYKAFNERLNSERIKSIEFLKGIYEQND